MAEPVSVAGPRKRGVDDLIGDDRPAQPSGSLALIRTAGPLEELGQVLPSAQELGLRTDAAEGVLREAVERLGVGADVFVLALVGGTGVGKSSLLNALAGETISPAGVRRPTTDAPVAWVPTGLLDRLAPMLARLGIAAASVHSIPALDRVVILDLPDLDSIAAAHRAVVDDLLPKVDVVAWVTDPEKYADGLLHDAYLRHWLPRLDRQIMILNKSDRLGDAAEAVRRDLRRLLGEGASRPKDPIPAVILASARWGAPGVAGLRDWIVEAADAKAVVVGRLDAAARRELANLASAAGVLEGFQAVISPDERLRTVGRAVREALRVVDEGGAGERAIAATRAAARRRGTGPAGWVTSRLAGLLGRGGHPTRPAEYVREWRGRGSMTAAAEAIRATLLSGIGALPPTLRPRYVLAVNDEIEGRLGAALDAATVAEDPAPPTSRWWPLLGFLQAANQLLLALVAAWLVVWFIVRPTVPDVVVPIAGPLPAPLILLAVSLLAGYVLARLLSLHAGWLGRRWASRLTIELRDRVGRTVSETAFAPIDRLEAARERIRSAWLHASSGH